MFDMIKKYMNRRNIIIAAAVFVVLLASIVLFFIFGKRGVGEKKEAQVKKPLATEAPVVSEAPGVPVTNPIDFNHYWTLNTDIYAYIYIPNTNVDYPMLQHPTDNAYYLNYNMDGSKGLPGCIYTEFENSKEFTDSNTIIYGHNMKNGTMFRTLHKFEDQQFFNDNRNIYIYTPTRVLQYRIFAAYTYSDDRIVYYYKLNDPQDCQRYLDMVIDTAKKKGFLDESIPLNIDDKLITLVTCTSNDSTRWLVQAKLVEDIPCNFGETVEVRGASAEALDLTGSKSAE